MATTQPCPYHWIESFMCKHHSCFLQNMKISNLSVSLRCNRCYDTAVRPGDLIGRRGEQLSVGAHLSSAGGAHGVPQSTPSSSPPPQRSLHRHPRLHWLPGWNLRDDGGDNLSRRPRTDPSPWPWELDHTHYLTALRTTPTNEGPIHVGTVPLLTLWQQRHIMVALGSRTCLIGVEVYFIAQFVCHSTGTSLRCAAVAWMRARVCVSEWVSDGVCRKYFFRTALWAFHNSTLFWNGFYSIRSVDRIACQHLTQRERNIAHCKECTFSLTRGIINKTNPFSWGLWYLIIFILFFFWLQLYSMGIISLNYRKSLKCIASD